MSNNPYDGIKISKRHIEIRNREGKPIFSEYVEFPDDFDDSNAAIVASRYLCNNAKKKEVSLIDMIDRISDQITEWAKLYFETEEELKKFNYKLKYYQIRGYFAFNSPVYFNVGLAERPQTSACFILNIEDNMDSIFEITKIESAIFKYGSGSGINMSSLRSSKERVSRGGYASGPISFLKAHDVVAGVIKSGGTLRRSAKLVCLDDTHPDIEEFICCKDKEEEKLRILAAAGIKPEPGYDISDEVFYQNTNISVRLSDEFMKAVERDDIWKLKYVTTGEVYKTIKARDLLMKISEHAWRTGDPGVQFSDNINKWNTVINDGEIKASNPCLPLWAPVLTPTGYRYFRDLKNKIFINGKEYNCSDVIKTKDNAKVYQIELGSGMSVYCTDNHLIKTKRGDVAAKDLKDTDEVKMCYDKINYILDQDDYEKGLIAGYLFAKDSIVETNKICFHLKNPDCANHLEELLKKYNVFYVKSADFTFTIKEESIEYILNEVFKASNKNQFDLLSLDKSISYQKGFIDAFISSDGYTSSKYHFSAIKLDRTKDYEYHILKQIQLILASLGIYSYLTIYNNDDILSLSISDVKNFAEEFKIYSREKQKKINRILAKSRNRKLSKLKQFQKIRNIKFFSEEDVYDINVPDVGYFVTSGAVVHNCGEFVFLNNSSCNLASINLLKFFNNYEFDYDAFKDVVETMIIAQDALIDNSSYPTKEIEDNSRNYRPLGAGYTNLGALLMYLGYPYDSDQGRRIAALLTALETGIAYLTSNKLAKKVGSFKYFDRNRSSFYKVLNMHKEALDNILNESINHKLKKLENKVIDVWNEISAKINQNESFRNATVTLLAPTGTISSLMRAATTGIEPEFSLVKYKTLSNSEGSTLKFVNPIIKQSLENLGYSKIDIDNIIEHIMKYNTVERCTLIKPEHARIFYTAIAAENSSAVIDYMGHVKMCAAVQPFLSMAISKTINLPNNVTVKEIFDLYLASWKMGLKGVTVYRNGSKSFQPLSIEIKKENNDERKLIRKRLPNDRPAHRHKFRIGNVEGYLSPGFYEDGTLGEIFIDLTKEGSTLSGFADALATIVSISLQYGVPLKDFVNKMMYLRFEPAGFTNNPDIKTCTSIVDYIFRYLGLHYLSEEDKIELGLISNNNGDNYNERNDSSPVCPECGNLMKLLGTCWTCTSCGWNKGSCG